EAVGIRNVISKGEIDKVVIFLREPTSSMHSNWSKRYRENMEKLKTGQVYEVAEVFRNLLRSDMNKSLSTGEKKLLNDARQILLSEIILATGKNADEVEVMVSDAILG
ncbi:MAG: CarD family transcriptional regulator, partial [Anaerovoracaceae bacterium]